MTGHAKSFMIGTGVSQCLKAMSLRRAGNFLMLTTLSNCCASIGLVCRTRAAALVVAAACAMALIALQAKGDEFSELGGGNDLVKAMLQSAVRSF
jgi:hypothetical protein